jgi:hypothetical protein
MNFDTGLSALLQWLTLLPNMVGADRTLGPAAVVSAVSAVTNGCGSIASACERHATTDHEAITCVSVRTKKTFKSIQVLSPFVMRTAPASSIAGGVIAERRCKSQRLRWPFSGGYQASNSPSERKFVSWTLQVRQPLSSRL